MGIFNTYGEKYQVQLKVGRYEDQKLKLYVLDERVPPSVPDGVYIGFEGVVVVYKRKVVATFPKLIDKWNNELDLQKVLKCQKEAANDKG